MNAIDFSSRHIEWREDIDPVTWDRALAELGGHPLQSALWGDARRAVNGIRDYRWMALSGGVPIWMIRVEERPVPALGWVGWVPKGPSGYLPTASAAGLRQKLKSAGISLLVTDAWRRRASPSDENGPSTIWIDLSHGHTAVWNKLDRRCRYGIRRAEQRGFTMIETADPRMIDQFVSLCAGISERKNFRSSASGELMRRLLQRVPSDHVEARLMVTCHGEFLGAGALILRCGQSAHYLWGATNREFARERFGEAVQWKAIQWALERGCTLYDLEGVDPKANPGTFAFKKKMGGEIVALEGKKYVPFTLRGRMLAKLDSWR